MFTQVDRSVSELVSELNPFSFSPSLVGDPVACVLTASTVINVKQKEKKKKKEEILNMKGGR